MGAYIVAESYGSWSPDKWVRVEILSNLQLEFMEIVKYELENSLGSFLIWSSHDISSNLLMFDLEISSYI